MVGPGNIPGCDGTRPACETCSDLGVVRVGEPTIDWCPNRCHEAHALLAWIQAKRSARDRRAA